MIGVGNGNSLQHSCLENCMERGVWRATVHGVAKSRTGLVTEQAFTQTAVQMARLNYKAEGMGFPCGSAGEESPCNVGGLGSIPGLGRCPREGKGYPLQYSCLENPMDRGVWRATVHGVAKSQTRLSN